MTSRPTPGFSGTQRRYGCRGLSRHAVRTARLAAVISGTAWLVLGNPARSQDRSELLQSQRQQLEQVQAEREQMQRQVAGFRLSEQEALQEIATLSESIKAQHRRTRTLEEELARTMALQAQQDAELADLTGKADGSRARITVRLVRLYRLVKSERSATLFQLTRSRTFARDVSLLARVQTADQDALKQYETLGQALQAKTAEVRTTVERLRGLRADLDGERKQLAERERGLRESLRELKRNQQLYAKYLADLDGMQSSMQEAVVRLERDRVSNLGAQADPATVRGRLLSPVPNARLLERFGDQGRTVKKFQRGILLGPAEGATVRAAAAGSVVHAGPFRGYEELVVLDHGNGLFTVYGHLDKLAVVKGVQVEAGASLGTVAWAPEDGRPELYFEVRLDGKPEDPEGWLAPAAKDPGK